MTKSDPSTFAGLFTQELARLRADGESAPEVETQATGTEPFVTKVSKDLVGLALSGGGVRSATFNVGVLQALCDLKILGLVDFLSTVSGGGYTGGFWTRFLRTRKADPDAAIFPSNAGPGTPEPPEILHLRRFGNFLSPRTGLLESETWAFLIALLSAILVGLLATTALIFVVETLFRCSLQLSQHFDKAHRVDWWALSAMVLVHAAAEFQWRRRKKVANVDRETGYYIGFAAIGLLVTAGIGPGLFNAAVAKGLSGRLIDPTGLSLFALQCVVCIAAPGFLWLALRWIFSRWSGTAWRAAIDRGASRHVATALMILAGAAILAVGDRLLQRPWTDVAIAPTTTVASSSLIAYLLRKVSSEQKANVKNQVVAALRPYAVQILAWAAAVAFVVSVAVLAARFAPVLTPVFAKGSLIPLLVAGLVLALVVLFFDPARAGLHDAYRGRIARAYLGAARPEDPQAPPATQEIESSPDGSHSDDMPLSEAGQQRPVHLICCTVNDPGGDPLTQLGRGGRSGTLSGIGFNVGDRARLWSKHTAMVDSSDADPADAPGDASADAAGDAHATGASPTLASALTAAAAAFNPNMGSLTAKLGPAVSFILAALNLRLGLWLRHPGAARAGMQFPGHLLFVEMFGLTRADGDWIHLSDGGHFENLGVYELVRRRCRYIIVSDCGMDKDATFDDLGNAIRRVREDFGVEIRIDAGRLRPGDDGLTKQHAVVGDIVYGHGDYGVLVLLKPSLTGDEPEDVRQYHAHSKDFPHQSTGDQFFDEEQWESYRRLGDHVTRAALDLSALHGEPTAGAVFNTIRRRYYVTPPGFEDAFLQMTERCAALEREIRETAPKWFFHEIFPELDNVAGAEPFSANGDDWRKTLHLCLQMGQLIEDVWVGTRLDGFETHPLNIGWMNCFHRWAAAPTFRMWWPVLRPTYSPDVRRFVDDRLKVGRWGDNHLRLTPAQPLAGRTGPTGWATASLLADLTAGEKTDPDLQIRTIEITLRHPRAARPFTVEVGAVLCKTVGDTVQWRLDRLHVPPGLWGAGIGGAFLRELLADHPDRTIAVELPPGSKVNSWTRDRESADAIQIYREAGFGFDTASPNRLIRPPTTRSPVAVGA